MSATFHAEQIHHLITVYPARSATCFTQRLSTRCPAEKVDTLRRLELLAAGAALLWTGSSATAQVTNPGKADGFDLHGSVRLRLEGIDNQFRPNLPEDDALFTIRTALHLQYHAGPVTAGVEVLDVRGYFQRKRTSVGIGEINALEPLQAYLKADLGGFVASGSNVAAQAGRFTMDLGSKRLVAGHTFRSTANSYTGARVDWTGAAKDKLTLFWVMPQTRLPNDADGIRDDEVELDRESTDQQFFGGSLTKADVAGGASLEVYAYRLHERDDARYPTRNRRLVTPGVRLYRGPKAGATDFDLEATYQFGEARASSAASDTRDLDVSAYFVHAELGRSFATAWPLRLSVVYDRGSGDRRDAASYNRFDTLFGSRRNDFGPLGLYGPIQRSNLSSPGVRVDVEPGPNTDAFVAYRALWLDVARDSFGATEVRDRTGGSGRFAGQQIEGRVRHWLVPKTLRLDTGAAYLIKGSFLSDAPNAPPYGDTVYGYMDVIYEF